MFLLPALPALVSCIGSLLATSTATSIAVGTGSFIAGNIAVATLAADVMNVTRKEYSRGFVDTIFKGGVKPVPGSVISCHMGPVDHTGIYVGDGMIVHRDGDGRLVKTDKKEFLARFGGFNPAFTAFVSCSGTDPIGGAAIAARALAALEDPSFQGYNLFFKNCHQFTQYCVTGCQDNGTLDFTHSSVERMAEEHLGFDNWRAWEG